MASFRSEVAETVSIEHTAAEPLDGEIARILLAIEAEPVPVRLQELALELQKALAARRSRDRAH